ncbi:hypothetical protein Tco_0668449, partial [Tanacetum coccineum]
MYAEVILGTNDETSSKVDTSSNDEISSSEYLINYLSARDVEWKLPKNTQEEPPKPHYDPIKTRVEEPLRLDIVYPHSHVASSVMSTIRTGPVEGNAVARRVIDDLVEISGETSINGYMRFFKAQQVAEMPFDDPREVFDTLMGLRDDIRVEEAKLAGLNDLITQAEEEIEMKEAQLEVMDEFPTGDEMFLDIDEVVFKIHTKGYFEYDLLRYVNGFVHCVSSFTCDKDGLKLLHTDNDVHSFIDAAVKNGSINLYVAHKKQNLGKYYYKNMEWEEDDAGLRCSSSTPFSTRVKTKISKRKKTSVIHDEGDDRKKSLVTGGRKGKEKVIEDEGICSKGNKADVTIYKRAMVNRKAKMVEDVGVVKRGKERGVVIEDGGFSNDGGKETVVTKRAIGSRKMEGKSVKVCVRGFCIMEMGFLASSDKKKKEGGSKEKDVSVFGDLAKRVKNIEGKPTMPKGILKKAIRNVSDDTHEVVIPLNDMGSGTKDNQEATMNKIRANQVSGDGGAADVAKSYAFADFKRDMGPEQEGLTNKEGLTDSGTTQKDGGYVLVSNNLNEAIDNAS